MMSNTFNQSQEEKDDNEEKEIIKAALNSKREQHTTEIRAKKHKNEVSERRNLMMNISEEESDKKRQEELKLLSIEEQQELTNVSIESIKNDQQNYENMEEHLKNLLSLIKIVYRIANQEQMLDLVPLLINIFNKFNTSTPLKIIDILQQNFSIQYYHLLAKVLQESDFVRISAEKIPVSPQNLLSNLLYSLFLATETKNNLIPQVIENRLFEKMLQRFSFKEKDSLNDQGWVFLFALYCNLTLIAPLPQYTDYFSSNLNIIMEFLGSNLKDRDQDMMIKYLSLKSITNLVKKEVLFAKYFSENKEYLSAISKVFLGIGPFALLIGQQLDILITMAQLENNDSVLAYLMFEEYSLPSDSNEDEQKSEESEIEDMGKENNQIQDKQCNSLISLVMELVEGNNLEGNTTIKVFDLLQKILLNPRCIIEYEKCQIAYRLVKILKKVKKVKSNLECLLSIKAYISLLIQRNELSKLIKFIIDSQIFYNFDDMNHVMRVDLLKEQLLIIQMLITVAKEMPLEIDDENSHNPIMVEVCRSRQLDFIQTLQYHKNIELSSLSRQINDEFKGCHFQ